MITDKLSKLDELFGSYRAEWLQGKIFEYFAEPYYFRDFKSPKPCVLLGGRGTGKTTLLKGLSYQGQFMLKGKDIEAFDQNDFIGVYFKADLNHMRSFKGNGLDEEQWDKLFSHYFNLVICWEILQAMAWHKGHNQNDEELDIHSCQRLSRTLHLSRECSEFEDLIEAVEDTLYDFQADINNVTPNRMPLVSMAGDAIKQLTEYARHLKQFQNKMFFILLDEYENLLDYQQRNLNTLIKNTGENQDFCSSYTFKIGVRELGWRVKSTKNPAEHLYCPADYELCDIQEKFVQDDSSYFNDFAKDVCQQRISQLLEDNKEESYQIAEMLKGLTIEEEAELLKVDSTELYKDFIEFEKEHNLITDLSKLQKYFLSYWAKTYDQSLIDVYTNFCSNPATWKERYYNYNYTMLFKIKTGRGKGGIQKYYAGWDTFIKLANGNIRYLMELVYNTYAIYLRNNGNLRNPVSPEIQTKAAREVGLKNLKEMEGMWMHGAQLTKLVLGLGQYFNNLAKEGDKTAPEAVQFSIEGNQSERTRQLISAAVMDMALIRIPGNKISGKGTTRDYLYSVHPIYAPYFMFSYRRKRKMTLRETDILGLIDTPSETLTRLYNKKNLIVDKDVKEMKQLTLFDLMDDYDQ